MNISLIRFKSKVKGMFQKSFPYNPILDSGNSSAYFGSYEGQKFGPYDTNLCWDFSATELLETRFKMLHELRLISEDDWNWLKSNGYIDNVGDPYFSRRWEGIISGVKDNGNFQGNYFELVKATGIIPNSMLPYDPSKIYTFKTKDEFVKDYFNPNVITLEMEKLGLEFKKRFNIDYEIIIGDYYSNIKYLIESLLKEGSIQLGIPVPQDGSWNQKYVSYPKGRTIADHAIECTGQNYSKFPIEIYDSYIPNIKQLSDDYYITFITRVRVTSNQINPPIEMSYLKKMWVNIYSYFRKIILPYPDIPIGNVN